VTAKSTPGPCSLCLQPKPLRESHVIPAFVGRWLKKDIGDGVFIRASDHQTVKQDTTKLPLLCADCENLRSPAEKWFREHVFVPFFGEKRCNVKRCE